MFCSKCGNELREADVFCSVCGNKVGDTTDNTQILNQKNPGIIPLLCSLGVQTICLICGFNAGLFAAIMMRIFLVFIFITLGLSVFCIVKSKNLPKHRGKVLGIVFTILSSLSIIIIVLSLIFGESTGKQSTAYDNNYNYDNYTNYTTRNDTSPASIFSNLYISNFSASPGKYSGRMQCRVTNNNSFTVRGYFYVNFYDSSRKLMYSQLMSLPSVASGSEVTCSTSIPKSNYPTGYSYVDFSQASLVKD